MIIMIARRTKSAIGSGARGSMLELALTLALSFLSLAMRLSHALLLIIPQLAQVGILHKNEHNFCWTIKNINLRFEVKLLIIFQIHLDAKTIEVEGNKALGKETSFVVDCVDSCQGVDIIFETLGSYSYYATSSIDYTTKEDALRLWKNGVPIYASQNDKPRIQNNTCTDCKNLCEKQYNSSCTNISTSENKFYLTVYQTGRNPDVKLTFTNVASIHQFGRFS